MPRPFFKDLSDSGFPEKWFSLVDNTLITAAAMVLWREGSMIGGIIAAISYLCLATQLTHGTRTQIEYLKRIYLYPNAGKFRAWLIESLFVLFKLQVLFAPIGLVWWAYSEGKVPL